MSKNQRFKTLRVAVLSIICSAFLVAQHAAAAKKSEDSLSPDQVMLSNGYALLYDGVSGLAWTDKVFLIKFESDEVEKFGKELSSVAKALKDELQAIADNEDWINLQENGLPEIERRKQSAVLKDRLKSFAPIVGRSQANFERTLLLSNSGALNQMQHLASVLMEIEKDEQRTKFLKGARDKLSDLYEADIELLNNVYFCDNTAEESKGFR